MWTKEARLRQSRKLKRAWRRRKSSASTGLKEISTLIAQKRAVEREIGMRLGLIRA